MHQGRPRVYSLLALCALVLVPTPVGAAGFAELQREAERLYAEGSYQLARERYEQAAPLAKGADQTRWVTFRLADTAWRVQASAGRYDASLINTAVQTLEALAGACASVKEMDAICFESRMSLGDLFWLTERYRSWHRAWEHYEPALAYLRLKAKEPRQAARLLAAVRQIAAPPWRDRDYSFGYHGNYMSLELLDEALRLAPTAAERAELRYLLARTLIDRNPDPKRRDQAGALLEQALAEGKSGDWVDDALYFFAVCVEDGRCRPAADQATQPDYRKAEALYRRLLTEFTEEQSRFHADAETRLQRLLAPQLSVGVPHAYLPGSEVELWLGWRNLEAFGVALYAVDLTRDLELGGERSLDDWLAALEPKRLKRLQGWQKQTGDRGDHQPGEERVRLQKKLEPGAYLVTVEAGDTRARDLVLVSDLALVAKTGAGQLLAYTCGAVDGAPRPGAELSIWERTWEPRPERWRSQRHTGRTNGEGLLSRSWPRAAAEREVFLFARHGAHQAFTQISMTTADESDDREWRAFVFADRPAYRPNETAHFKVVVRQKRGMELRTPARQVIAYAITDPRGTKVGEGKLQLNAFGSAAAELALTERMPLGEYTLELSATKRDESIGSATLFRLEEYKLPEFTVTVRPPQVDGKSKRMRPGEELSAEVQVDYYFGGGVPDAEVVVEATQTPFYPSYEWPSDSPWPQPDEGPSWSWRGRRSRFGYGYGGRLLHKTLRTDATGKALVTFALPAGQGWDSQVTITARVTDASRREVVGAGFVRVTERPFFVHLRPAHEVFRRGAPVVLEARSLDAYDVPTPARGRLELAFARVEEVWLDERGQQVTGEPVAAIHASGVVPKGWQPLARRYRFETVASIKAATNDEGALRYTTTLEQDGYYRARWLEGDRRQQREEEVLAETFLWVASAKTERMELLYDQLSLTIDSGALRLGGTVPALITVPGQNRSVLLTIESTHLHRHQLLRVRGNATLLELPVTGDLAPNVTVALTMVADTELHTTEAALTVPPLDRSLTVEITPAREVYEPRQTARFRVSTRDGTGKPTAAEVALAVVDEAVFAIQSDYAGDPRPLFYDNIRGHEVQTSFSGQQKELIRLVAGADGALLDERTLRRARPEIPIDEEGTDLGALDDLRGARPSKSAPAGVADLLGDVPASARRAESRGKKDAGGAAAGPAAAPPAPPPVQVQVRADFRATALWEPALMTNARGEATVSVALPETLTRWRATGRAVGPAQQFGAGSGSVRTEQPLMVRLQAPRFFVVGDQAVVSALVNNHGAAPETVEVRLTARGLTIEGLLDGARLDPGPATRVTLAPGAERRVDWRVRSDAAGPVELEVSGRAKATGDAMKRTLTAYAHGIDQLLVRSGKLRDTEHELVLDLPPRRPESTTMTVHLTPSVAVTMLDALPYLIDYPYGCTEQTMSRFLPAVIVGKTLRELGLPVAEALQLRLGDRAPAPKGKTKGDLRQLDAMIEAGRARLVDFQHDDGGWGWWREDQSNPFMTGYVLWGLSLAEQAGVSLEPAVRERAAAFLDRKLIDFEAQPETQAWLLHALVQGAGEHQTSVAQSKAFANAFKRREQMTDFGKALLALAALRLGRGDDAGVLVRNLENGVRADHDLGASALIGAPSVDPTATGSAHWGQEHNWWRWHDGAIETTSFALLALLAVEPQHRLVGPAVTWLLESRRGCLWTNTRDTAIAVLALSRFLSVSGELGAVADYEVQVNGRSVARRRLDAKALLTSDPLVRIDAALLRDGENRVRLIKHQGAALYYALRADFFTLAEPITAAGHALFVRRDYLYAAGQSAGKPLRDGASLTSGDRVEVVLTVEAKHDYEYVLLEDLKPAGLEALEAQSGAAPPARLLNAKGAAGAAGRADDASRYAGPSTWTYRELRDRKVVHFISHLPQGTWELRYLLRAEVPGRFHALPLLGQTMYAPDVRANGDEVRLVVRDRVAP